MRPIGSLGPGPPLALSSDLWSSLSFTGPFPFTLAVAGRAAGQRARRQHVVVLDQAAPEPRVVGRRLPGHVEDLVLGPDVPLRVPVAIQTPLHLERRVLVHERHAVDPPVAGGAA